MEEGEKMKTPVRTPEETEEYIRECQNEIDRLLEERPEYCDYQKEIERRLEKAVTTENKIEVLKFMIEDRRVALAQAFNVLAYKLQEMGKIAKDAENSVKGEK